MSEQNKAVIRDFLDAINKQDLERLGQFLAPTFVWHGRSLGEIEGVEPFKEMVRSFYAAMPDLNVQIDDLIAERETVVARFTVTGTHKGDLFGIPGSGHQLSYEGHPIYRLEQGRIAEVWFVADTFGLDGLLWAVAFDH